MTIYNELSCTERGALIGNAYSGPFLKNLTESKNVYWKPAYA